MASGSSSSWSSKICIACNRVIGNRQSSLAASNSCSSTKPASARNRLITTLSPGTRLPPGIGLDAMSSEHRHCTRSISMSTKASKSKTNRKILRSSPPTSRPSLRLQDSSSTSVLPSGSIKALFQTRRVTGSCGKEPQTHGEVIRTAETEEDGSTTLAPTRKKQSEVHFKNRIKVLPFPHSLYSSPNQYANSSRQRFLASARARQKEEMSSLSPDKSRRRKEPEKDESKSNFNTQKATSNLFSIGLKPLSSYGVSSALDPLLSINLLNSQVKEAASSAWTPYPTSISSACKVQNQPQPERQDFDSESDPRFGDSKGSDIKAFEKRHRNLFSTNRVTAPYLPFPPSRATHTKKHFFSPLSLRSSLSSNSNLISDLEREKVTRMRNKTLYFIVFVAKKKISKLASDRNRVRTKLVDALREVVKERELEMDISEGDGKKGWKLRLDQLHVLSPSPAVYSTSKEEIKLEVKRALMELGNTVGKRESSRSSTRQSRWS